MNWNEELIKKIKNKSVKARILKELRKPGRLSPVTGSIEYWEKIVESELIDYRVNPELYRIGKGQQGVLSVEPYKSEILPHWRFATEEKAKKSAKKIYQKFLKYIGENDFVGADMAKKFLHMGFTRARRYANHSDGKKYSQSGIIEREKDSTNNEKAKAASIFKVYWDKARKDQTYSKLKKDFKNKYEK